MRAPYIPNGVKTFKPRSQKSWRKARQHGQQHCSADTSKQHGEQHCSKQEDRPIEVPASLAALAKLDVSDSLVATIELCRMAGTMGKLKVISPATYNGLRWAGVLTEIEQVFKRDSTLLAKRLAEHPPRKYNVKSNRDPASWSDAELVNAAKKIGNRTDLKRGSKGIYTHLQSRDLLDVALPLVARF